MQQEKTPIVRLKSPRRSKSQITPKILISQPTVDNSKHKKQTTFKTEQILKESTKDLPQKA